MDYLWFWTWYSAITILFYQVNNSPCLCFRIQEVFSYLKSLQLPVGAPSQDRSTLEKQQRLQEVLKGITMLFKRLHLCYERAQEQTGGMEYTQVFEKVFFFNFRENRNKSKICKYKPVRHFHYIVNFVHFVPLNLKYWKQSYLNSVKHLMAKLQFVWFLI